MGDVAELKTPPDFGDGDGGEYDWVAGECENCGKNNFCLWWSEGVGTLICTHCGKPQEDVYTLEVSE